LAVPAFVRFHIGCPASIWTYISECDSKELAVAKTELIYTRRCCLRLWRRTGLLGLERRSRVSQELLPDPFCHFLLYASWKGRSQTRQGEERKLLRNGLCKDELALWDWRGPVALSKGFCLINSNENLYIRLENRCKRQSSAPRRIVYLWGIETVRCIWQCLELYMLDEMCQQVSVTIKDKWVLNSLRQGTGAKHFKDLYNSLMWNQIENTGTVFNFFKQKTIFSDVTNRITFFV
jgi:hypothetical protein